MDVIVGSLNLFKKEAVENALKTILSNNYTETNINIFCKNTDSGVSGQPIGIDETKQGAINRMKNCYPKYAIGQTHIFCIGIENGLVSGNDLNKHFLTNAYSDSHCEASWYDIGICAVTVFKGDSYFKFISYAEPLCIPNDELTGFVSPLLLTNKTDFDEGLNKYGNVIKPLIQNKVDLYDWYSGGKTNRMKSLSLACLDSFKILNNIHPYNHNCNNQIKKDIVIMFGTFDLFHDLHKRLIDHACLIGKQIVIYVYGKKTKSNFKTNSKVKIYDDVQKRISTVTKYILTKNKHKNVCVNRMFKNHYSELKNAIEFFSNKGTIVVMGGDDQFNEHYKIVKLCSDMSVPIVSLNRGETKLTLCSSDIREKLSYQKVADNYDLDFSNISPFFWKNRIHSLDDAKNYIKTKLKYVGLDQAEIWKYIPLAKIDKRIISTQSEPIKSTKSIKENYKTVLCLPGRTKSVLDRFRKIALTIQNDFVPEHLHKNTSIYVACYDQNSYDTEYHCEHLKNNYNYFSDDAMIFTKLVIMPIVCKGMHIEKYENEWILTNIINIDSIDQISKRLENLTICGRSIGSVIAIEMENAFKYCMKLLGFNEDDIINAASKISVLSISNLASLDRPRLFNTVSVTGINDKKALKFIQFPRCLTENVIDNTTFNKLSDTHLSVLTIIPQKVIELGSDREIIDDNCHYTPLYTALRENDSNLIPKYIRSTAQDMISR